MNETSPRMVARPVNLAVGLVIAALWVVCDQLTKRWGIAMFWEPVRVLPVTPWLNLTAVWNRGVTFGFFQADSSTGVWLLIVVALCLSLMVLYWLWNAENWMMRVGCGLILGGAIGNKIDRFTHGAVFDFIDVHYQHWHWPAFNVADIGIVVGVGLLLWDSLFRATPERRI